MLNLRNMLFAAGGVICVVLAFLGVLIPVLPTTPLLLLAAFLFTRSSPRALHWLENNRLFGAYIRNYRSGRGMKLRDKVITLALLWLGIGLSIVFLLDRLWLELLVAAVAAGVTAHLVRIKTCRPGG